MTNENPIINSEVITLVKQLKSKSIGFYDVPNDYRSHPMIVATERELGMRISIRKGYDVIHNNFFVDELICDADSIKKSEHTTCLVDFSSYYDFLQGDIYEDACYYGYYFSQNLIDKYSIDVSKLNFKALIHSTIDDFSVDFSTDELLNYRIKEFQKNEIKQYLDKLNSCISYSEFSNQLDYAHKFQDIPLEFFMFNFIFNDKAKAFNIIMEYINRSQPIGFEKCMCLIYEPKAVLAAYNNIYYQRVTAKKYKKRLEHFVNKLESSEVKFLKKAYFDKTTHFWALTIYCEYEEDTQSTQIVSSTKYLDTFQALMKSLRNDLSYCDLSNAIIPNLDLSKYKISGRTILPIQYQKNITCQIEKFYDKNSETFVVNQIWKNEQGITIKSYHHDFKRFFDFVYFLKNDLSNADLLFCDGLINIADFTDINMNGARLRSVVLDKIKKKYVELNFSMEISPPAILENEDATAHALMLVRPYNYEESLQYREIFYVSDLHLQHRLMNANCKSAEDVVYILQKIIDDFVSTIRSHILNENVILIGGDTSANFSIFKQFIGMLRTTLDERKIKVHVVFVLGNHELWDFPQFSLNKIVAQYRQALEKNDMFLLQNNIIFKSDLNKIDDISTEEIKTLSSKELQQRLMEARVIIFGGLAFAGYNEKFNADLSIYRNTINRRQEIKETKEFEMLYHKVCNDLSDKRIIVFTHTPPQDWCHNFTPHSGYVYVNGHTHMNYFHDDGDYRIYADNQIGYKHVDAHLKSFYIDDDYDTFADYKNGIYELSREQYIQFYKGKHIVLTFTREFHKLFMLKKNGYYMFVMQSQNGQLAILNGGNLKKLEQNNLSYYFDKMDEVITYIKNSFDKFTKYQEQISNAIKSIGGLGTIHGSIVDIDFYNHIFVNPIDHTATPYFAENIINKMIFPDIPSLLKSNCPTLYNNYLKLIEGDASPILCNKENMVKSATQKFQYLDTDIYRISREIKKMQKLNSNIISIWIEPPTKQLTDNTD